MQPMKFGEDRTMYAKVISDCVLWRARASPQSLRVFHGHTLQTLEIILLTFNFPFFLTINPPWQRSKLDYMRGE